MGNRGQMKGGRCLMVCRFVGLWRETGQVDGAGKGCGESKSESESEV